MNLKTKEVVCLSRECIALMVPSGARIKLQAGTEVTITQALGDSFTVNVYGNLARIDASDADALGKEAIDPLSELDPSASVEERVWAQLKRVFDPEIPVNIVDLGLVYRCAIKKDDDQHNVEIEMTLTAPGCGMGPVITEDAKRKVELLPDVAEVNIEMVFDPPWDQSKMSEVAKLELGML